MNIKYHKIIKNHNKPEEIRYEMIKRYEETKNYSLVAREFKTKRTTVRKWVKRYKDKGKEGLKDLKRTPKHIPHKTPKEIEEKIVEIAKAKKCRIGQDRIKEGLPDNMKVSTATINRIMHEYGLIKKRKRKWQKKKEVSRIKRKLKALRYFQVDVKDLIDIPNVVALVKAGIIPRYQYTARDVLTGTMFVSYGYEHSIINSTRFVSALFEHLKRFGIHPSDVVIQTDNGPEFIGSIHAKEDSLFTKTVQNVYKALHKRIPPGKKEYQGVVESSHGRIEYEFYDVESFDSLEEFLSKAYTYTLYFNLKRKKLSNKKTPFELIKEKAHIFNPKICDFKPILLDSLNTYACHYDFQGVPYVGDEVNDMLQYKKASRT